MDIPLGGSRRRLSSERNGSRWGVSPKPSHGAANYPWQPKPPSLSVSGVLDGEARFDYERLGRFLDGRGVKEVCPFCGVNSWTTLGPEQINAVFLSVADPDGSVLRIGRAMGGIYAYCLTCENCGFIRLHNAQTVDPERDDEAH